MRGAETIYEVTALAKVDKDWQGDPKNPAADPPDDRAIDGCQWIPILDPEDGVTVLEGGQIFVPPDQTPPSLESQIRRPDDGNSVWMIDGGIAAYDMRSVAKGYLFKVKRVA